MEEREKRSRTRETPAHAVVRPGGVGLACLCTLAVLLTAGPAAADETSQVRASVAGKAEAGKAARKTEPKKTEAAKAEASKTEPRKAEPGGDKLVSGMSILGNDEAPKSLVIVPWKSSALGDSLLAPQALDDSRTPVDRDVFMRELSYYEIRKGSH